MEFDVVVVGAGPAGSTAAYFLARKGFSVCLVEKEKMPRRKACAGGLCRHIREFSFIEPGFLSFASRACVVHSPSMRHTARYEKDEPLIYQVDRALFDYSLARKADSAGARIMTADVKSVSEKGRGRIAVRTSSGELRAEIVIGAGGVFCPVAAYLRKKENLPRLAMGELSLALVADISEDREFIRKRYPLNESIFFFLKELPEGYAWIFPKEDRLNIGLGAGYRAMKKNREKAINAFAARLKKHRYISDTRISNTSINFSGAMIPGRGPLSRTSTDRVMIAGDAAGFVSPVSGEGIYTAMDSGRIAAETAARALGEKDFSAGALASYHRECMKRFGHEMHYLARVRRFLPLLSEMAVRYSSRDPELMEVLAGVMSMDTYLTRSRLRIARLVARNALRL